MGPIRILVRGEWRSLARAMISIGVIAAASAAIAPGLWLEWFGFLGRHLGESTGAIGTAFMPPPAIRIPVGVALIIWAARRDKRRCIPVAMLLCSPVLWLGSFTLLAAIPRILAAQRTADAAAAPAAGDADRDPGLMNSGTRGGGLNP